MSIQERSVKISFPKDRSTRLSEANLKLFLGEYGKIVTCGTKDNFAVVLFSTVDEAEACASKCLPKLGPGFRARIIGGVKADQTLNTSDTGTAVSPEKAPTSSKIEPPNSQTKKSAWTSAKSKKEETKKAQVDPIQPLEIDIIKDLPTKTASSPSSSKQPRLIRVRSSEESTALMDKDISEFSVETSTPTAELTESGVESSAKSPEIGNSSRSITSASRTFSGDGNSVGSPRPKQSPSEPLPSTYTTGTPKNLSKQIKEAMSAAKEASAVKAKQLQSGITNNVTSPGQATQDFPSQSPIHSRKTTPSSSRAGGGSSSRQDEGAAGNLDVRSLMLRIHLLEAEARVRIRERKEYDNKVAMKESAWIAEVTTLRQRVGELELENSRSSVERNKDRLELARITGERNALIMDRDVKVQRVTDTKDMAQRQAMTTVISQQHLLNTMEEQSTSSAALIASLKSEIDQVKGEFQQMAEENCDLRARLEAHCASNFESPPVEMGHVRTILQRDIEKYLSSVDFGPRQGKQSSPSTEVAEEPATDSNVIHSEEKDTENEPADIRNKKATSKRGPSQYPESRASNIRSSQTVQSEFSLKYSQPTNFGEVLGHRASEQDSYSVKVAKSVVRDLQVSRHYIDALSSRSGPQVSKVPISLLQPRRMRRQGTSANHNSDHGRMMSFYNSAKKRGEHGAYMGTFNPRGEKMKAWLTKD
jgi:hypothetical protein